jgi:hypothetical protein
MEAAHAVRSALVSLARWHCLTLQVGMKGISKCLVGCGHEPVQPAYNPSFSACFFSQNSIFFSQQISQQCFSAGLSAQPNGAMIPQLELSIFFTGESN